MKSNIAKIIIFNLVGAALVFLNACEIESTPTDTDLELFKMAKETEGFTWYKNSANLLPKSIGSGHGQPFLRTRYNSIAASSLDTNVMVSTSTTFAAGSLIVKELYEEDSTLTVYAIMYKNPSDVNADEYGWVWSNQAADGSVFEPASNRGLSCNGCHSQPENIDHTLMNKYFPLVGKK
ncbi:MAG: cytochrome P460 family protein [Bacteroidales bacterium]